MKNQIMTRNINSIVGHFVAECNLEQKITIIRDPRNGYKPIAFVPSVEKADILQAIRRVGQQVKLAQSFELLGIQNIADEGEINMEKADKFLKRNLGTGKQRTRVVTPLRPGGSLPEEQPEIKVKKAAAPKSVRFEEAPESKQKTILKRSKAPGKKLGKEHGW